MTLLHSGARQLASVPFARGYAGDGTRDGTGVRQRMFTLHSGQMREATLDEWFAWATRENVVLRESVVRGARVHTLFLGTNWGADTDPVFFMTHVSGGPRDGLELRAGDLSTALENHAIALVAVKG